MHRSESLGSDFIWTQGKRLHFSEQKSKDLEFYFPNIKHCINDWKEISTHGLCLNSGPAPHIKQESRWMAATEKHMEGTQGGRVLTKEGQVLFN